MLRPRVYRTWHRGEVRFGFALERPNRTRKFLATLSLRRNHYPDTFRVRALNFEVQVF